ncbi:MAG TPA: hypothetical protein V6D15_08400 [Oculatellaceae cyanobacterium]
MIAFNQQVAYLRPFEPGSSPTPLESPSASPPPDETITKIQTAEEAITKALNQIPKGDVYHNVPNEMQVGVSEIIEAGIAPKVTDQIRKKIQGRGGINVESGVQFDPSGMEMKLVAQPDEFKVFEVKGGEQFVTTKAPGKWIWRVEPLKAGDNLIVIKAAVKLKVPKLGITRPVEVEVFSATRKVKVNLVYSISQFVTANWKEVLGLVVGSGSLASFATWWMGRKTKTE